MDNFISYLSCHGVHIENMQVITMENNGMNFDVKIQDIDYNFVFRLKQDEDGHITSITIFDGFKTKEFLSNIDLLKFLIFKVNK